MEFKNWYGRFYPSLDCLNDKGVAIVTNWSSFPYENIIFDHSSPVELLVASTPFLTEVALVAYVTFRGKGSERSLVVKINTLYDGVISAVKALSAESGLFSHK